MFHIKVSLYVKQLRCLEIQVCFIYACSKRHTCVRHNSIDNLSHSVWKVDLCIGLYELMDMLCGAVHRQVRCEMHRAF